MLEKYIDFCECGNYKEVIEWTLQNLKRMDVGDNPDYNDLGTMFFWYWADSVGISEHGVSVRCSWLTDEGKSFMIELEQYLNTLQEAENAKL